MLLFEKLKDFFSTINFYTLRFASRIKTL